MWKKYKFFIQNLDCANCARSLEEYLNQLEHYQNVVLNFSKLTLTLETNYKIDVLNHVISDVKSIEQNVRVLEKMEENNTAKKDLIFLGLGLIFYLISLFMANFWFQNIFVLGSYCILGHQTFLKAIQLLKKGILNENFLIVVSAFGAFFIEKSMEGFMVLFLYQIGKYFEKKATGNVRKSISLLMSLKPSIAHKKEGNKTLDLSPEKIQIGDTIVVLQGEKVPLDGILLNENCELDTASLTGESKVMLKEKGEEILSGSVNNGSVFEMKVTSLYENSTVKRILDLMEHASDKKAKTENFVNRASKYYTPIMMVVSFLIFFFTPILFSITYQESLYRAFMVLVVSCPCAIAISVPLCYFAGLGSMSKHGILVKGSNYIDLLANYQKIVFDKTGTLTTGDFGISSIVLLNSNYTKEDIIKYLVYGETYSNHPLAKSILKQYTSISVPKLENVVEEKGKGISYIYEGQLIRLGNEKFVHTTEKTKETVIYLSIDDDVIGYVTLGDNIKENAKEVISSLKDSNVFTTMFTGDHKDIAKITSEQVGLDDFVADLLPDEKFHQFELLKKKNKTETIAFVGDGINDAPVLRLSDCGIAMGSGSESAIEASDVVIISSDLEKLLEAKHISKKTLFVLKQNLIFALGLKIIVICFSLFGIGSMVLAVFADVGVTLLTILNSLRILK